MAQLAEAYAQAGQVDKSVAVYNQISQLYPGSAYENVAKAGRATLSLKAGKIDEALAAVQPILDQANKDIAPSPSDGALYANAFLVYGQVLEAQKKPQQALEAYLTVKTMFYQNPVLVDQAEQLRQGLARSKSRTWESNNSFLNSYSAPDSIIPYAHHSIHSFENGLPRPSSSGLPHSLTQSAFRPSHYGTGCRRGRHGRACGRRRCECCQRRRPSRSSQGHHLSDMLSQGGFVMYILAAASVCLVWFTAEGFVILRAKKLAPPALIARLREAFKAGNYQEAWNICKANRCFLSNVLGNGLERVGRNKDAVEFIVEETALREANDLKTNTTYLSVIGVVSPMIGLTGTVWGMIGAFKTLGDNGISNPSLLAGKIGEVLVATMSGLVVAVPAFIFFYILRARAQSAILHAESQVYRLLDDIPYDQLSGRPHRRELWHRRSRPNHGIRSGVSQKVSRNVTTNCPSCNAPITVGTTPCPNCDTVLDWGT